VAKAKAYSVQNSDIRHRRSERPLWVMQVLARLNDRFREIALQCRELFHDLVEAWWRSSLHQHQAASSATETLS
ncbi:hypothetical protein, partial [Hyphomonas sp.]|uniref:hypothetical protein n=1 Tax=Hyphomonas sp. TaxID=87 RepID=UPI003296C26F